MTGNTFVFILAADHKAGDILQEHQRNIALTAQLNKMRAFLSRLTKQNTVVGDNTHFHAFNMGKATDQSSGETGFEFIKFAGIDNTRNNFTNIKGLTGIGRNYAIQLFGVIFWWSRLDLIRDVFWLTV